MDGIYARTRKYKPNVALITSTRGASCSCDPCVQNRENDYIVDLHVHKIIHYFVITTIILVNSTVLILYYFFVNASHAATVI